MTTEEKGYPPPMPILLAFLFAWATALVPLPDGAGDGKRAQLVKPISKTAGIDGVVIRVTNLAAEGLGSLREALDDRRPRLVVFEVGGVIDLRGRSLVVREPHLTVAGQTAPDPGITIIRGSLVVETSDVVIQHIAVRPGDGASSEADRTPDAMGTRRGKSGPVRDVVFDHCSATWAIDENLSASGPADVDSANDIDITSHDITLRSCLIAEGLSHSVHPKGEHSKGTLIHDGVRNVSIIGCLYAHNRERNPRLKGGTTATLSGSVMYDWGNQCVGVGARGNRRILEPAEAMLIDNVAIAGPDTRSAVFVKSVDPGAKVMLRDNVAVDAHGAPLRLADDGVRAVIDRPAEAGAYTQLERVLRTAGSRPARRDAVDARIVQSVIDGTGHIIDGQQQVGGYPVRGATKRALVVPENQRAGWLQRMSDELEIGAILDMTPLWKRLNVAPSPDSRK